MSTQHPRRLLPSMTALTIFEAAARAGSFGRAASRVFLTQSAVSRGIAALEESLGVTLFQRAGRRVQLTDAGRAYAEQIGIALDQIRRATATAMEAPKAPTAVCVATLPSFGMRRLACVAGVAIALRWVWRILRLPRASWPARVWSLVLALALMYLAWFSFAFHLISARIN